MSKIGWDRNWFRLTEIIYMKYKHYNNIKYEVKYDKTNSLRVVSCNETIIVDNNI